MALPIATSAIRRSSAPVIAPATAIAPAGWPPVITGRPPAISARPSLSQQIRRLEQQLGVLLLDRSSRRVELTAAGQVLLRDGHQLLGEASRIVRAVRSAAMPCLTVGFYGSAAIALLPVTLREFGERHPSITVTVRELALGSLDEVRAGEIDVAFTRLAPGQTDLEVEVLFTEPRVVALPAAHRLARRPSVAFTDLHDEAFITNPFDQADGDRPPRWLTEQRRHKLPGRVVVNADPAVVSLTWRQANRTASLTAFIETARAVARSALVPHLETEATN